MIRGSDAQAWAERLLSLGDAVRARVLAARASGDDMASAVAQEGGDTIFAIDRHVEPVIEAAVEAWPASLRPLTLIAEGLGATGRRRFEGKASGGDASGGDISSGSTSGGTSGGTCGAGYRLIVDPIDGTRSLMYDKRSAWFIAAVAPEDGEATALADAVAAAVVELPTSLQPWSRCFAATTASATRGWRVNVESGVRQPLTIAPSRATALRNGFAQVSSFFPGTKVLAAELMERIVRETLGEADPGTAAVFDDQYITTAGQMVELMLGHDRFCCDLRPLFYRALERQTGRRVRGLECHPYDVAGMLVAQQAGVILTDGFGQPLDAPLDVETGVHWCGYANERLRARIEPVIVGWLREHGVRPE